MRQRGIQILFFLLIFLFWGLVWTPEGQAGMCALCRRALAMGGNEGLVRGFYWSILLIAGMPLLIFVAVGIAFYRMRKKITSPPTETFD